MRTAAASRRLPPESKLRVVQAGGALEPDLAARARREEGRNPRYRWVGELPRWQALRLLSRSHLLALTSRMEGGANVVCEALALGVPVISSEISGSIGLLGPGYPGYFPVGDTGALAGLLLRAETETAFYERLGQACRERAVLVEPARERRAWRDLLAELGGPGPGPGDPAPMNGSGRPQGRIAPPPAGSPSVVVGEDDGREIRMAYAEHGDPDASLHVLLLHGLFDHKGTWSSLAPHLVEAGHHVIAPDLIGFGRSSKPGFRSRPPSGRYRAEAQVGFVRAFVESLGLDEVVLVGNSYGGGVLLRSLCDALARRAPGAGTGPGERRGLPPGPSPPRPAAGRLAGPTAAEPAGTRPRSRHGSGPGHRARHLPARLPRPRQDPRGAGGRGRGHPARARHGPCLPGLGAQPRAGRHRQLHRALPADRRADPRRVGAQDRIVPPLFGLLFEAEIPDAALHVFDGCGHAPHLEYPAETAGLIRDWIRRRVAGETEAVSPRGIRAAMTGGNIGADGARFRLFFGVLFLVFALGLMALLTVTGAPPVLRLTVFAPLCVSIVCLAESRTRVCVLNAARGVCATEDGTRPIEDDERRLALAGRAWRLILYSLVGALALTAFLVSLSTWLPWRIPAG